MTFPCKLDCGSYIISIAKTASKKIGALVCSMKFLSAEVALYLYKATIYPCMEYCCHVWAGAHSCYLELLKKLQKRICRTVGRSLAASLEPLAHRRNVASLSLFYRYFFGRCSSELTQQVSLPFFFPGGLLIILIDCMIFHVMSLWNSLTIRCFPLTYNLNDFKSRINRHLINCRFLLKKFPVCFNLFLLFFLVTPCLVVAVQLCME